MLNGLDLRVAEGYNPAMKLARLGTVVAAMAIARPRQPMQTSTPISRISCTPMASTANATTTRGSARSPAIGLGAV